MSTVSPLMLAYVFNPNSVFDNLGFLLEGVGVALALAVAAVILGLVLAAGLAPMRMSRTAPIRWCAMAYIEIFRMVPLLVILYIVFFGLPAVGLFLPPLLAGLIGLTFYSSAYMAEILRAGILSVDSGQWLAARSLGMSDLAVQRHIVWPQATRNMLPAFGNQFIETTLGTSMVSIIGGEELTQRATYLSALTFRPFEVYAAVGLLYLLMTRMMVEGFSALERRFGVRRRIYVLPPDGALRMPGEPADRVV